MALAKAPQDKQLQKQLALKAASLAERVLPLFEKVRPKDKRPRKAIEAARTWARTGIFHMAVIRKASLDAHAAARATSDPAAKAAARAAGQAVATAHVATHSLAAAYYAAKAMVFQEQKKLLKARKKQKRDRWDSNPRRSG